MCAKKLFSVLILALCFAGCSKQEQKVEAPAIKCNPDTLAGCTQEEIASIQMGSGSLDSSKVKLSFPSGKDTLAK